MPQLAVSIDLLIDLIQQGKINSADSWAKDLQVSPSNASFLMSLVSRVILERRNKEITAAPGDFKWEKGYVPMVICAWNILK